MSTFPPHLFCSSLYFGAPPTSNHPSTISDLRSILQQSSSPDIRPVLREFGVHTLFRILCEENQPLLFHQHFVRLEHLSHKYQALMSLITYGEYLHPISLDWKLILMRCQHPIQQCHEQYAGLRNICHQIQDTEWKYLLQFILQPNRE